MQGADKDRVASDFLCEVFAVQDGIGKDLILLYPTGTKDQESIKEVFAQKSGKPKWIVTDGDSAMPRAIRDAFGEDVIHYRCEEHLRDDAKGFAKKDGVVDPEVLWAIEQAQYTPAHWERLKAVVAAKVDPGGHRLRKWIADNESLVLHQCELRRLHPRYPRSTGGPENALTKVRHDLNPRRASLRNRRRLLAVLDLMRVAYIHKARPERYARIVREQLEAGRHSSVDWDSHWDRMVKDKRGRRRLANSLIEYRDLSRGRNALAREIESRAATAARTAAVVEHAFAQAVADGGQPSGRVLRTASTKDTFAAPGDKVADVPSMLALWDFTKNAGIDPSTIAAQGQHVRPLAVSEARGRRPRRAVAGPSARVAAASGAASEQEPGLPVLYAPRGVPGDLPPGQPPAPGDARGVALRAERRGRPNAGQRAVGFATHGLVALPPRPRPLRDGHQVPHERPLLQGVLEGGRGDEAPRQPEPEATHPAHVRGSWSRPTGIRAEPSGRGRR